MTRSFKMMLNESEKDQIYFLMSPYNIMKDDMLDKISIGLHGFDLVEVTPVGKHMNVDSFNPYFPDIKSEGTYELKIITSYPMNIHRAKIQLSQYLGYDPNWLILYAKGEAPERQTCDCEAVEEPRDDNQELVGTKRIGAFMAELEAERKKVDESHRASNSHRSDVCINHVTLQEMVGKRVRRGYYVVETYGDKRSYVYGPYNNPLMGMEVVEKVDVAPNAHRHLTESGFVFEFSDSEYKGMLPGSKIYVVPVIHNDTGGEYDVKVRADSPERARKFAITRAARKLKVTPDVLSATMPE